DAKKTWLQDRRSQVALSVAQYARANQTVCWASLPQQRQTCFRAGGWKGMFREVNLVSSFTFASHAASPHQPASTNPAISPVSSHRAMWAFSSASVLVCRWGGGGGRAGGGGGGGGG